MRTVKEKADEWQCSESTARKYCRSGIIPPAEQEGVRQIPDEWPKPPMTRRGLCYLLDTIYQLNHGVSYDAVEWGYKTDEVRAGYEYLVSGAFMSTIDVNSLSSALIGATVTPRGEALIERENTEGVNATKFRAHVLAKTKIGSMTVEAGAEISNGQY